MQHWFLFINHYSHILLFLKMNYLYLFIFFIHQCYSAGIMDHVVFAVNCGGEAHTDVNGKIFKKSFQ
jgi:hypothetical protein